MGSVGSFEVLDMNRIGDCCFREHWFWRMYSMYVQYIQCVSSVLLTVEAHVVAGQDGRSASVGGAVEGHAQHAVGGLHIVLLHGKAPHMIHKYLYYPTGGHQLPMQRRHIS